MLAQQTPPTSQPQKSYPSGSGTPTSVHVPNATSPHLQNGVLQQRSLQPNGVVNGSQVATPTTSADRHGSPIPNQTQTMKPGQMINGDQLSGHTLHQPATTQSSSLPNGMHPMTTAASHVPSEAPVKKESSSSATAKKTTYRKPNYRLKHTLYRRGQ